MEPAPDSFADDTRPSAAPPSISVIVPAFNGARTLEHCLRAIRRSTLPGVELIVVDDGSRDDTRDIAHRFADVVIVHEKNRGRHAARCAGFRAARGAYVFNVDQDVVLPGDALARMSNHLTDNPGIDAVTSRLSADSPSQDFFSEYKNIYMSFVFSRLPYFVDFLYGSFFGLRSPAFTDFHLEQVHFRAHDTAWGLQISSSGGKVALLKDLEVVHLKKYTFRSIIHNDFQIPYDWADIFISFKKWRDIPGIILRRKSFAHASTLQLATICLAYGLLALLFAAAVLAHAAATSLLLAAAGLAALAWLGLNRAFFSHIHARKGVAYLAGACAFTFVDNITMGLGIVAGLLATAMGGRAAAPPGLEERV